MSRSTGRVVEVDGTPRNGGFLRRVRQVRLELVDQPVAAGRLHPQSRRATPSGAFRKRTSRRRWTMYEAAPARGRAGRPDGGRRRAASWWPRREAPTMLDAARRELKFRDPAQRARACRRRLARTVAEIGRAPVSVMHVCGSHEQAIARFGLRAVLPARPPRDHGAGLPGLRHRSARGRRGGGAGAAGRARRDLRRHGARARHGGVARGRAGGRRARRRRLQHRRRPSNARAESTEPLVFFATGFETTAVATAAAILAGPPPNFFVLSAHKYIPPVMEIVSEMPGRGSKASSRPDTRRPSPAGASSRRSWPATGCRS